MRFRNRITEDECRMTGEVSPFGLVGIRYDDDPRTFFISPSRLEPVFDVLGEQLTETISDPFGDAFQARAASLRPQPASRFSQSGIAIARKSA